MNTELNTMLQRLTALEERSQQRELHYRTERRRFRVQMGFALCAVIGSILISPANRMALAQGYGVTLTSLDSRLRAIEGKTQFMSADATAKTTKFSGCNVCIVNGLGATNGYTPDPTSADPSLVQTNGLGNLILGYNESFGEARTGSHNLVLGTHNAYTSFSGVVAGADNTISAPFASIYGGVVNTADVYCGTVLGGISNRAGGTYSCVSGGSGNHATGFYASILGGGGNIADGENAVVCGGVGNESSGNVTTVCGGYVNKATGNYYTIGGGANLSPSAIQSGWTAGSQSNTSVGGNFHSP